MTITTYDTVFATNDGALTADNTLKPTKGEIVLLERDGNTFQSATITEVISVDEVYDL